MNNILLIDEDLEFATMLRRHFPDGEFSVVIALGGKEGLKAVKDRRPNLVLCCVDMHDLHGFQVLHSLKSDILTANIPVILLAMRADLDSARKAETLGADDYVHRFTARHVLVELVRAHLKTRGSDVEPVIGEDAFVPAVFERPRRKELVEVARTPQRSTFWTWVVRR
jgi:two-component system cell cycle response regulator